MNIEQRYNETRNISAEIWKVYKECYGSITKILEKPEEKHELWWDKTFKMFNDIAEKYYGTTHEYYAHAYAIACLDDLNAAWKLCEKELKKGQKD